jgi:hypothetical protein
MMASADNVILEANFFLFLKEGGEFPMGSVNQQ